MTFSTDLQTMALSLLSQYGEIVSFVNTVNGDYNPATGDIGSSASTAYMGYGHPSPYNTQELTSGRTNDDILHTDIKLLIQSGTLPQVGDIATMRNLDYRVMSVSRVSAQSVDIVYKLQLRV